jgi:hypothetical protein
MANQVAKDSTLDGGIEIETSSLDFDSSDSTAKPVDSKQAAPSPPSKKVGLLQYSDVDEFGL